jgi:hypothetical protein
MNRFYIWYVDLNRYSHIIFHNHEDAVKWSLKTTRKNLVVTKDKTTFFAQNK